MEGLGEVGVQCWPREGRLGWGLYGTRSLEHPMVRIEEPAEEMGGCLRPQGSYPRPGNPHLNHH
jgi:hypothetical protein